MPKLIDITGQRFGRLVVIERYNDNKNGEAKWKCHCDCGNEAIVSGNNLRSGKTKSCGCQKSISSHNSHFEDLRMKKFGKLTVIRRADNRKRRTMWECKCDCGNVVIVGADMLKSGRTQSCGCLKFESKNYTHNLSKTRLYNIWSKIKDRCLNKECPAYKWYGARGITICKEWENDFESFYKWSISNGYREDLSIDRKDNDKGYSPENCRWSTQKEQQNNRCNNALLTYCGETKTLSEWEEITGIKAHTLYCRKQSGYTDEECFEVPLCSRRGKKRNKD